MDTSETYIKMCKKAEEIQKVKGKDGLVHGDYFYSPVYDQWDIVYDGKRCYRFGMLDCIWLPRQDQLQEMVLPDPNAKDAWGDPIEPDLKVDLAFWLVQDFVKSIHERKYSQQSMEQLWLRFVMKEKHNKVWDGEDWHVGGKDEDL